MYCPRPTSKTKKVNATTPGKKTVYAPAPRTEACNVSSSTTVTDPTSGGSTTNTINVPGPAGPAGATGARGRGFKWEGEWAPDTDYKAQSATEDGSVVQYEGSTYLAVTDNRSTSYDAPEFEPGASGVWELWAKAGNKGIKWEGEWALNQQYYAQSNTQNASVVQYNGSSYIAVLDNISEDEDFPEYEPDISSAWELLAQEGAGELQGEDKSFFSSLKDDVFGWVKNASIGQLLLAGAAVAGVIWAGVAIVNSLSDDGEGDGEAASNFTGSDSYLLTTYTAPDIKDVISVYCDAADITYDVSALPNEACEFTAGNQTSIRSILGTLALTYQFDMVDTGGILKFIPRVATVVKTIPIDDLGFVDNRNNLQPPYSVKRFQGTDLPKSITLKYPAADLDYNNFTQSAELFTYSTGQEVQLSTPVTLTHSQAKEVVEVSLINAHLQRTQYRFVTSYKHIELEPSDVISLADVGLVRLRQLSEKSEGLIEFIAEDAGAELATEGSGISAQVPPVSTNVPVEIGYSQAFFIDPPGLNQADVGVRMYAAVHGYDRAGWSGAAIYVSENNGASYELIATSYKEATFGLAGSILPAVDYRVWDETTTISVTIKANDLTSVSELDVLNGKNWCMIGQEVIGFKNAVLTAPKTYTLSVLLRGRNGTEQYVSTHVADELFILLDDALVKIDYEDNDRLTTKKYKVITLGSSLDKVSATDVQMVSNNTLMWTVYDQKLLQFGSDWHLSYKGRTRIDNDLKDLATTENDPDFAGYGILVMDGVNVKKSYTTTSENWIYSQAMQIADWGSAQSALTVKVAQLNQKYGAGYSITVNS